MLKKLASIIFKDVTGANESNRISYIVRINSMMMCVYFIIWIAVFELILAVYCGVKTFQRISLTSAIHRR